MTVKGPPSRCRAAPSSLPHCESTAHPKPEGFRMSVDPDAIDDIIHAMMRGERPTEPFFTCPYCGGQARLSAMPVGPKWLQVSVRCACGAAAEYDRGDRWPGCES